MFQSFPPKPPPIRFTLQTTWPPYHAVPCRAMPCHTVPTYQRQHGSCQALLTTQYSIETKLHYRCFLAREYKV